MSWQWVAFVEAQNVGVNSSIPLESSVISGVVLRRLHDYMAVWATIQVLATGGCRRSGNRLSSKSVPDLGVTRTSDAEAAIRRYAVDRSKNKGMATFDQSPIT
jgi:hypothetical protein